MLKLGDFVRPRPEWIGDPNNVPNGRVRAFGMSGFAVYVGAERRAFGAYVFDLVDNPADEDMATSIQEVPTRPVQADLFAQIED
jgi:hypothetical protein